MKRKKESTACFLNVLFFVHLQKTDFAGVGTWSLSNRVVIIVLYLFLEGERHLWDQWGSGSVNLLEKAVVVKVERGCTFEFHEEVSHGLMVVSWEAQNNETEPVLQIWLDAVKGKGFMA